MKKIYTLIFTIILFTGINYTANANGLNAKDDNVYLASKSVIKSLNKIFPDSLKQENSKLVVFCPDNTCIEFIKKDKFENQAFVIIYLFYEGDYYDLEHWRKSDEVNKSVHNILNELNLDNCLNDGNINHSCLKNGFKRAGVKISNVRYDEDRKFVEKVW